MASYMTELTNDLTCPICLEFFTHPIILPCCHVLCRRPCAENISSVNSIRCPVCRDSSHISGGVSSLPRVITLESIIEKVRAEQKRAAFNHPRLNTSFVPNFTNPNTNNDNLHYECVPDGSGCRCPLVKHTLGSSNPDISTTHSTSTSYFLDDPLSTCSHFLLPGRLPHVKAYVCSVPSLTSSCSTSNLEDIKTDLLSSSTDLEIQSREFHISGLTNKSLPTNSRVQIAEECDRHVNHHLDINQNICKYTFGTPEFKQSMNVSKGVPGASCCSGFHSGQDCVSSDATLNLLEADRFISSNCPADNACVDNFDLCLNVTQVTDDHQLLDLKHNIQEQLELISDIQCQLLTKSGSHRDTTVEIQNLLQHRRSEVNSGCNSLAADIENNRVLFLETLTEDSMRATLDVEDSAAVTEELLESSLQLACFAEHILNNTDGAVNETGPHLLSRIDAFLKKCELCLSTFEPRMNSGWHPILDVRHGSRRLSSLTRPSQPIIDVLKSTRSNNTVALVIAPPSVRDVIDSYEISYCSQEQKRQGIEEMLCAHRPVSFRPVSAAMIVVLIENLSCSTHYYFSACAVNREGRSPDSDYVQCQTLSQHHCVVPVPAIMNNLCHASTFDVSICCPSPTNVTVHQGVSHCILYRQEGGDHVWQAVELQAREQHRIQSLKPGIDYQFVVLARNSRGECQLSEKISLRTGSDCSTD